MATIPIVNTVDKRRGMIAATVTMALLLLYLLLTTIEMADPPPKDPLVMAETIMPEEIDLKDYVIEGGANAGDPVDDVVKPPTPQTEKVLTNTTHETFTHESGQSTHTNAHNTTNTSSTSTPSDNPFGSGGQNGGSGPGSTFGTSTGPGSNGPGTGKGIVRKRLNDPVFDRVESNEYADIVLVVTIDDQGNIVNISCNHAKTTTTNQVLINRVMSEVKRQVKYNKDPGSAPAKVTFTATITPQ